jgi:DEPDC5 protein C-terminal region
MEVLAMKSHNRRRWSHVFPLGEVEFKRHAGPNWKSLTAPAVLPLSIDYFPKQEEIDHNFTFSIYNVTLSEFEHKNYSSNKDLLDEMVRQRLTQDFQLVSEDYINASNYRREALHDGLTHARLDTVVEDDSPETIRQFLSMGHRLHAITYDPSADLIEVTRYDAKDAQKDSPLNTFNYQYFSYCQETQRYSKVRQTFVKYSDQYNWNKVDRIICGDDDREMREGMRFKRIMFGVIPENFKGDRSAEDAYEAKFRRFLEYLEKLRDKDESKARLDIKFVTSVDKQNQEESKRMESTPGLARNSMARFYIQLRKGKRDTLEWMEVALDSTFDTSWSYRIMFNWLVASSGKVDTQVQLLARRCAQYGLKLVPFPQITVSRNSYTNPFKAPAILTIRYEINALRLDRALSEIEFVHDGVFHTDVGAILESMDDSDGFHFELNWGKTVMGKQFVHRSGTLFVRVLTDRNGFVILVVLGNYRYMMTNKDETVVQSYKSAFQALTECVAALDAEEGTIKTEPEPESAPTTL